MKRLYITLVLIFLWFSSGIATAATALIVGGHGQYGTLTDAQMRDALGGYFTDYTRVPVTLPQTDDYGQNVAVATEDLYRLAYETHQENPNEKITIGAVSEGGPVVWEALRRLDEDLANNPDAPSPDELDVFVYGDPNGQRFVWGLTVQGYTYQPPPETPYDVTVVKAEYDLIADAPDNWFNLLAVVNAIMAADQIHVASAFLPLPAEPISETTNSKGGTTKVYLIPTPVLPLLKPLVDDGWDPAFVSALDGFLRPIIDSAYVRPSPVQVTAPNNTLASNEPLDLKATTLTLNSGSAPPDPGLTETGFGTTTQAQQALDTAAKGAVDATAARTQATTQAQQGLDTAGKGAAEATAARTQATTQASGRVDKGRDTDRDASTTGRPAGATDLTDGNKVEPGQAPTNNPTDHGTDVREEEQEQLPTPASDANDGPTNAADDVKDADPSASAADAGAPSDGDE